MRNVIVRNVSLLKYGLYLERSGELTLSVVPKCFIRMIYRTINNNLNKRRIVENNRNLVKDIIHKVSGMNPNIFVTYWCIIVGYETEIYIYSRIENIEVIKFLLHIGIIGRVEGNWLDKYLIERSE